MSLVESITNAMTGCCVSYAGNLICSLTGGFFMDAAEQREPDASRPVLRARGGDPPPRDSP
jgi:hypothetical protein